MSVIIHHNTVEKFVRHYRGGQFHALLTDVPYEYGIMGQDWDRTGIAYSSDMWRSLGALLYPGGFGMTYAGGRTWHRIACAIEDAGFIIYPSIFGWLYSNGMPKGVARLDTVLDKRAGVDRKVIRVKRQNGSKFGVTQMLMENNGYNDPDVTSFEVTAAVTEDAKRWETHRYGLQVIAPAVEPILVFQKPHNSSESVFDSMLRSGAGAMNIEGGRIGDDLIKTNQKRSNYDTCFGTYTETPESLHIGRWPKNFVTGDAEMAGPFYQYIEMKIDEADPLFYCPKPSQTERNVGLDDRNWHPSVKPISLNTYLSTLLLPPDGYYRRLLVPFCGSASEVIGGMLAGWDEVVGVERDRDYVATAQARVAYWTVNGNFDVEVAYDRLEQGKSSV